MSNEFTLSCVALFIMSPALFAADQSGQRFDSTAFPPPPSSLDRHRLRADTPAVGHLVHLNNAGASLPPQQVTERVIAHLRLEEQIGAYEAAERVAEEWENGRKSLAQLIGGQSEGIAIMESSTAALHKVLSTVPLHSGDRILVAGAEYAGTVLPLLQLTRRMGVQLDFLADGPDGTVDADELSRQLRTPTRMVFAVHAPSHNGLINDVIAIGAAIRAAQHQPWYVVDACQSLGQLPIDVSQIDCDFLLASGRKYLRGPRGTGVLCVGPRALAELDAFPLDVRGGTWARARDVEIDPTAVRFENYERSVAAGLGLMAAADYAHQIGIGAIAGAVARNAEYLRSHLGGLADWQLLDRGKRRSGIVVVRSTATPPGEIVSSLRRERVNLHVVPATSNPRELGDQPALRISPHAFNNQADLDRALDLLANFSS